MSTQINYYNQNNVSTSFNPFIQNVFNSKREINNYYKFNNNMNNAQTISIKNNLLDNPNGKIFNQADDISNKIRYSSPILTTEQTYKILNQINTCVCKIYNPNDDYATGFFCEIPFANSKLKVLITNNHVLNKDEIKVNRIIKIILLVDEKEKEKNIIINEPRITFTNEKLDVTIIEIIPKVDGINHFLEVDDNFDEFDLNQKIYILQNPKEKFSFSFGNLKEKSKESNKEDILYLCSTSKGSSGGPILNFNSYKVIGVHKGSEGDEGSLKIGTLMNYIIKEFENTDINKSKLNLKEKEKGAKIKPLSNNEFYVGNFKKGKIAIYYSDGKLKYEGDILDGKYEGKGTYYYNDEGQNRYEGEWKKGFKHGKGILYYDHEAKRIKYEGNFSNGKFEGKGIYYWNDGTYYIGDFVNGLKQGYGTYYKNGGKIKYEGGFVNDKFEGNGIYYCNDGNYYIGKFKDGLNYGKGKLCSKNGDIIKGNFVENKNQEIK